MFQYILEHSSIFQHSCTCIWDLKNTFMVWYILQNYHSRCLYLPESTPKLSVITINIQEAWEHEILFPVITDIYIHAIGLPYCFDVEHYKVIRMRLTLHCIIFQMLSADHILLLFLLNYIL